MSIDVSAETTVRPVGEVTPPAPPAVESPSVVTRALDVLKRDPVLFVTLGYVSIAFIGIWASWWFYRAFGLRILDYLQVSDFLVAGLREPVYALGLSMAVGMAWLCTWPERWRRRNPARAAALGGRWWAKVVFPPERGLYSWWGMRPDTVLVFSAVIGVLAMVAGVSIGRAKAVRMGRGPGVEVTLAGAAQPLRGPTRLLGTSASFAFLYWPSEGRIEAVTLESIARIRTLPERERKARAGR